MNPARPAHSQPRATLRPFVLLAVLLASAACSGKRERADEPATTTVPTTDTVATVTPAGDPPRADLSQQERAAREALEREGMVIYFDYDSAQVRAEYRGLLASHSRYAGTFAGATIRLEGHTDERGSREYNIGLGERRAQAVRQALELQGVAADRISTVSYGEERPAAEGSDEAQYARNRRVEIRYTP